MDQLAAFLQTAPQRISAIFEERENIARLDAYGNQAWRESVQRLFRQIHTLKGAAAAFNLEAVKETAHEIENFLEIINAENCTLVLPVLDESLNKLKSAFQAVSENRKFEIEKTAQMRWREVYEKAKNIKFATPAENILPGEIEEQLKPRELRLLQNSAVSDSQTLLIRAGFSVSNFAAEYQNLQKTLAGKGEIIASLPDSERAKTGEIWLQLIFVSKENLDFLTEILTGARCEIVSVAKNETGRELQKGGEQNGETKIKLSQLCETAALAARQTAAAEGKKVDVQTNCRGEIETDAEFASACETALLHLARNAVAHGIELPAEREQKGKPACGTVKIEIEFENDTLCLKVSDDGRGIDREKIRQTAIRRGLISENQEFDDRQAQKLIFLSRFSTAEKLTAAAGRGVGLDAAKSAIEEAGGSLDVSTESGRGTSFSIRLRASRKIKKAEK